MTAGFGRPARDALILKARAAYDQGRTAGILVSVLLVTSMPASRFAARLEMDAGRSDEHAGASLRSR